jgi:hypothetical protein
VQLARDLVCRDNAKVGLQGFLERTGIEPVTSGLQNRDDG